MIEFKPCPFCGATPEFKAIPCDTGGFRPATVNISCKSCGIGFSELSERFIRKEGYKDITIEAIEKLAKSWNNRVGN